MSTDKNVTADNWFSSLEVVDELLKINLTYVGIVKKDKKAIPEAFLQAFLVRLVGSSLYGFRDKMTTELCAKEKLGCYPHFVDASFS